MNVSESRMEAEINKNKKLRMAMEKKKSHILESIKS